MKAKVNKFIAVILISILSITILASCARVSQPTKPDDFSLRFWILDNAANIDLSDVLSYTDASGNIEFLDSTYTPAINESTGQPDFPESSVTYTIASCEDYAKGLFITEINITDPTVTLFGLTLNSTIEEFNSVFEAMGFMFEDFTPGIRQAYKDGVWFTLVEGISLHIEVV